MVKFNQNTWEGARLDCKRKSMDLLVLETKSEEFCFQQLLTNLSMKLSVMGTKNSFSQAKTQVRFG
jgi:hypothetical protein